MSIPDGIDSMALAWNSSPEHLHFYAASDYRQCHQHINTHHNNEGALELYQQSQKIHNTEKAELQTRIAALTAEVTSLKAQDETLTAEGERSREMANAWHQHYQNHTMEIETLNKKVETLTASFSDWKKTVEGWKTAYNGLLQIQAPITRS
jgi:uncharacterized coiled-coil DUF342 family protein